jgi:predicted RNase H-like nuclease
MQTFVGFDSAWTDNPKSPGAITAVSLRGSDVVAWHPPQLVSFDDALAFIQHVRAMDGMTIVALDQPTIVVNASGMRPVERVAASLVSWLGGGVQPANTSRVGMFCAAAPVWRFLAALGAVENPEAARTAQAGLFVIEVFPALALASLQTAFFGRLAAPRYNPARRRTFRVADWAAVASAAADEADQLGVIAPAAWCRSAATLACPTKADQDRLDAVLCALIALRWCRRPRGESLLLGDLATGYMVLPASPDVRTRLTQGARRLCVPVDGVAL